MSYNEFINNIIETRGQWNIPDGEYYESHHILPVCLGGEPKKRNRKLKHPNLIWLYPEEHYEAHRLLALENKDSKELVLAWNRIFRDNKRDRNISASEYAELKIAASKYLSEINSGENSYAHKYLRGKNNPRYGIPMPQWIRDKISKTTKNKPKPFLKGKTPWIKGKKHSVEAREKMSKAKIGTHRDELTKQNISNKLKGRKLSDDTCLKISIAKQGVKKSEEHKKKISDTLKGKEPVNKGVKNQFMWINNGINELFIKCNDYNNYIDYKKGRLKKGERKKRSN